MMYHRKNFLFFSFLLSLLIISSSRGLANCQQNCCHPFYVGVMGGYGSTTWNNLVPDDVNDALNLSVPVHVSEGGAVWGVFAGCHFIPAFAAEFSYMQYPLARLTFDDMSLFTFDNDGLTYLTTRTSRLALIGKFILPIPCTRLNAYSAVGVADVLRQDILTRQWRISPTFGAGLSYDLTQRVFAELATEYVAGYGQSEIEPANHYVPFLYSVFFKLAYHL